MTFFLILRLLGHAAMRRGVSIMAEMSKPPGPWQKRAKADNVGEEADAGAAARVGEHRKCSVYASMNRPSAQAPNVTDGRCVLKQRAPDVEV